MSNPPISQYSFEESPDYIDQRLAWRKSLTEDVIRSLAADYLRGMVDDCNEDGFLEYEVRYGEHDGKVAGSKRASKKSSKKARH